MNSFKVSVIIPVYNTELYIKQTVESIQKQTLYDIEIIIINDGSTDNSLSLLLELSKQDHRIKIFSQENIPQHRTRKSIWRICLFHGQ